MAVYVTAHVCELFGVIEYGDRLTASRLLSHTSQSFILNDIQAVWRQVGLVKTCEQPRQNDLSCRLFLVINVDAEIEDVLVSLTEESNRTLKHLALCVSPDNDTPLTLLMSTHSAQHNTI